MGFWAGLAIGAIGGGAFGLILACLLVAAKTSDPHSIPRKENPWSDHSSGTDMV